MFCPKCIVYDCIIVHNNQLTPVQSLFPFVSCHVAVVRLASESFGFPLFVFAQRLGTASLAPTQFYVYYVIDAACHNSLGLWTQKGTCQSLVIVKVCQVVSKTFVFAKLFFHAENITTRCVDVLAENKNACKGAWAVHVNEILVTRLAIC